MSALEERIKTKGPKKILCCDGGGILGLMSVEILAKIERDLREKLGKDETFVLADYFDFVCGTSTGAVITSCIATGMSMDRIRTFYNQTGQDMFVREHLIKRLYANYKNEPIADKLREEFGRQLGTDTTLGSPNMRTMFMAVMRNATTDSPWPVSNNPFAKYNDRGRPDCNLDMPLWQLVRASTAAPTFFPPEVVTLGTKTFVFVDGGVTTYNNPAFLAFLMATAEPYGVGWETGEDKLLIVSIGTGNAAAENPALKTSDMHLLYNATTVPRALMNAATAGHDLACRVLGACRHGDSIDREVGKLLASTGTTFSGPKLFSYVRYDPPVTRAGLDDLGLKDIDPTRVQTLDSIDYIEDIQKVGTTYAKKYVSLEHFTPFAG